MQLNKGVVSACAALGFLVLSGALAPTPAGAQDTEVDREEVARYARAHVELNDARDEFHGKVGRVHDEEGRRRAREELNTRVAEIFAAHEMRPEEYDEMTLRISLDGKVRAVFEEILAELEGQGGS